MPITNIPENTKPNMQTLDNNFNYLVEKYNSFVEPINSMLEYFSPYPFEPLTEITSEDITPYVDETYLTAEKLNSDFGLFRNKLLALGLEDDRFKNLFDDLSQLELLVPSIPLAPTGLDGSLSDGDTLTCGLTWTDNATNEDYFEVWMSSDRGLNYSLVGLPIENAEFHEVTLSKEPEYNIDDILIDEVTSIYSYCKYYFKVRAVNTVL